MKKVSICINCEREVYTNDLDLCKKCYQDVGLQFLKKLEPEEELEEEAPSIEDLGIEAGEEGESEEVSEEPAEEVKE